MNKIINPKLLQKAGIDKSNPKYNSVQCVGVTLDTGIKFNEYSGYRNDEEDWEARVELMKTLVEKASDSSQVDASEKCLKVFMAPEFFFRGRKGAYNMDTCSKITESLREIVNQPKYKDWLFVFGTMLGYSVKPSHKDNMHEVYNYTFIQKGNSGEKDSFVVLKQHKSGIDFINSFYSEPNADPATLNTYNTKHLSPIKMFKKQSLLKVHNYDSNSVFDIDGIRFGVEICLDHLNGRIDKGNLYPFEPIDVHLVTSSGVGEITPTKKLSRNGISFVCDGSGSVNEDGFSKVVNAKSDNIKHVDEITCYLSNNPSFYLLFPSTDAHIKVFTPHKIIKKELQNENGDPVSNLIFP